MTWNSEIKGRAYEKLDIKGAGGYAVCPPSRHANGRLYTFFRPLKDELPPLFDPALIQPLKSENSPAKIVSHPRGSQAPQKITGSLGDYIRNEAPEGTRHTVLVKLVRTGGSLILKLSQNYPWQTEYRQAEARLEALQFT